MNSRKRIRRIIRNSAKTDNNKVRKDEFKPDWNELLVMHLNRDREKSIRRKKLVRAVSTAAAVIVLTFLSLLFLTSLDEIRAGNFNFFDAIRDLGRNIELNEIYTEIEDKSSFEKSFSAYDKYSEFLLEHPLTVYYKGDFSEIGYEVTSIQLSEYSAGNTLDAIYKNETTKNMFSLSGFIRNPRVDSSTDTVYPGSVHTVRDIDGITVDFHEADFGNFAIFTKGGIEFTMEYFKILNEHIDVIISGIRVYGR